jgi:hypothetical protein
MTDMERFIELYKSFGIELEAEPADKWDLKDNPTIGYTITMDESEPKFKESYGGFYSVVYFDREGKFINQGFWE